MHNKYILKVFTNKSQVFSQSFSITKKVTWYVTSELPHERHLQEDVSG